MSRTHINPYRINDDKDLLEVTENSSHPELQDSKRLWHFGAYTFKSGNEVKKFFEAEGLDITQYWFTGKLEKDIGGRAIIHIYIKTRIQLSREESDRARRLGLAV